MAYSKDFILMTVKHMSHKAPMGPEPLSSHHVAHASFLLRHVAYMVSVCVHDHILVGLFESTDQNY